MDFSARDIRMAVNIKEVYRYMGFAANVPDDNVKKLTGELLSEFTDTITPKYIYKIYDCEIEEDKVLLTCTENDVLELKSKNLADNLRQCHKVILMAATLGIGADKLLHRYEIVSMAKASIVQACGAACIETYCNLIQENIKESFSDNNGLYLRPRFSPGYGDLPLETQKNIFLSLECIKRIGLTLTDSLLMYPTKSVTAFIGLTKNPKSCNIEKCKNCKDIDCGFRI